MKMNISKPNPNRRSKWKTLPSLSIFIALAFFTCQFGLAQTLSFHTPPVEYSNIQVGGQTNGLGGVGTAAWNNRLYVAYADNSNNGVLWLIYSADGSTFSAPQEITANAGASNPALAVNGNTLYVAYVDFSGATEVLTTTDGTNFQGAGDFFNYPAVNSPSLVIYKNIPYVAFTLASNDVMQICQVPGNTCNSAFNVLLGDSPSLTVFNNTLYVAFHNNTGNHYIYDATSTDAVNFTVSTAPNGSHTSTAPSITVHNGVLYIIFRQNSTGDRIYYTYSTNGTTFVSPIEVSITMGGPPSAVTPTFNCCSSLSGDMFVLFRQNDTGHYLFTTYAP